MRSNNHFYLARTKYNQNGPEDVKTVSKATSIAKSCIEDLESNVGKLRGTSYLKVAQLALHYGVSMDYLAGLPDAPPTTDQGVKAVCMYTGLSQEAAEELKNISSFQLLKEWSSFIIASGMFSDIASALNTYAVMSLKCRFVEWKREQDAIKNGYRTIDVVLGVPSLEDRKECAEYALTKGMMKACEYIDNHIPIDVHYLLSNIRFENADEVEAFSRYIQTGANCSDGKSNGKKRMRETKK